MAAVVLLGITVEMADQAEAPDISGMVVTPLLVVAAVEAANLARAQLVEMVEMAVLMAVAVAAE